MGKGGACPTLAAVGCDLAALVLGLIALLRLAQELCPSEPKNTGQQGGSGASRDAERTWRVGIWRWLAAVANVADANDGDTISGHLWLALTVLLRHVARVTLLALALGEALTLSAMWCLLPQSLSGCRGCCCCRRPGHQQARRLEAGDALAAHAVLLRAFRASFTRTVLRVSQGASETHCLEGGLGLTALCFGPPPNVAPLEPLASVSCGPRSPADFIQSTQGPLDEAVAAKSYDCTLLVSPINAMLEEKVPDMPDLPQSLESEEAQALTDETSAVSDQSAGSDAGAHSVSSERWEQWKQRKAARKERKAQKDAAKELNKKAIAAGKRVSCPSIIMYAGSRSPPALAAATQERKSGAYDSWYDIESQLARSNRVICASRLSVHTLENGVFQLYQNFSQRPEQSGWQLEDSVVATEAYYRSWC
mmetsp:Transcript_88645/g.246128  ORF Transcript_88645/g.246128 Transcript_88645/m.246128 type:complete len:422 (-) Transcript_88645:99-1364(-)|eukprot:CAMPEP_0179070638 /NCGR_PEP_ID=MMETSP0796-20121207/31118_1 /TAXON_ID=73915 /ORGANISM="Pyrodinium bahamense, Strain pbaha01" /LENGTH=421 /DNA_ID=CAMNT_0020767725 /DNA_START=69 /DNA_END=1334 /DNA_ORIENTATION=-